MFSKSIFTVLVCASAALASGNGNIGNTVSRRSLTLDGARRIIAAAAAEAKRNGEGGVIAVVDDGGNLMALERLDGTFAAGANISVGKARTAVLFQKPTKFFEDVVDKGRTVMVALNDFTPLQGGVPVVVDGETVGGVGVSGAKSAAQDEHLAMTGAAALSMDAKVTYFDSATVSEGFAKGSVLFDAASGENYMVHASRREGPGLAEIHTKDADVIYVQEGSATFVTGGTAVNAKQVETGELRGERVEGGETRQLNKGDVVIVPAGTPHWFREVSKPFLYYVVKVR